MGTRSEKRAQSHILKLHLPKGLQFEKFQNIDHLCYNLRISQGSCHFLYKSCNILTIKIQPSIYTMIIVLSFTHCDHGVEWW